MDATTNLLVGLVAATVGGLAGWMIAASRSRLAAHRERAALESQLAAADSREAELRTQATEREASLGSVRQQLTEMGLTHERSKTQLEESAKRLSEQERLLDEMEKKLKESFESLSAKVLQANAEQFLQNAKKTLESMLAEARGDLGRRQEAIGALVKPVAESLKRYETQIQSLERVREKAYGSLEEQVKALTTSNQELRSETGKLVTALRDPKVRGRWGELALKRAAELAGMSEHCDFEQQVSITDADGRWRPDLIVHLPGGRVVAVDAKAVLDAYLDAIASGDETTKRFHLTRHAAQVRSRMKELAAKAYWERFDDTPEFVVLFLPGESFFSAAVENDPKLIEDAISRRVILASPTTFIALLRAISYGWQQEKVTENAKRISELGRELFDRMHTLAEHLDKIGTNLGRAVNAYNDAVGSLERRVLPSARRFKELGAARGDDIVELNTIDGSPRDVTESP